MADAAGATGLKDKVAVITGASSGIGAAVARELAGAGVKLLLTARREDKLTALAGELKNVSVLAGDITDPALTPKLLDQARKQFGSCDIVVNNAGELTAAPIELADLKAIDHMVEVNVSAAFRVAYAAAKLFKEQGHGHLVNISSVLATRVRLMAGAYSGTKHALAALGEALRMELSGTGIRVSAIEPGLVMTELHDRQPLHPRDELGVRQALEPADVARCVRFALEQPSHVLVARLMVLASDQQ
ncbi:MAG: SDR family oxidoreductase [Terriglobales bacterium]